MQGEPAQEGPEEGRGIARGIARGHSVLLNGTVVRGLSLESRAKDCFQLVRVRGRERERARRQDARGARRTLRPSRLVLNLGSLLSMALDLALPSLSHPQTSPTPRHKQGKRPRSSWPRPPSRLRQKGATSFPFSEAGSPTSMIVHSFWLRHLAYLQNNPGLGAALSSLFSSSSD